MNDFVQYVLDFYGKDGIHCMNATVQQVTDAVETYKKICELNCSDFAADSVDRENIRDLMIRKFGLKLSLKKVRR